METHIGQIISDDLQTLPEALKSFIDLATKLYAFPCLDQNNYRQDLWKSLSKYLLCDEYASVKIPVLITIRMLSREKTDLNKLVTRELLDYICDLAGLRKKANAKSDANNLTERYEAVKCLVNLVYSCSFATTTCSSDEVINGLLKRIADEKEYENAPFDMKLLDLKVLFILSALGPGIPLDLKDDCFNLLVDTVKSKIADFIDNPKPLTDHEVEIICEILKILFNITIPLTIEDGYGYIEKPVKLVHAVRDLFLLPTITPNKKIDLQNHSINLLTNVLQATLYKELIIPSDSKMPIVKQMQYEGNNLTVVSQILDYLKNIAEKPIIQYEVLAPVLSILVKCAKGNRILRKYLRQQIFPPLKDVTKRPEEGDSLRNVLCRLLTTPMGTVESMLLSEFLFILCKENIGRMVKYTGYGNAAGLLARKRLLGKVSTDSAQDYSSDSEDSDTEEYKELKHGINPVLGCYEPPKPKVTDGMTEEQKEYEAMQLVLLIDRLSRQGVVQPCSVGPDGAPKPVEHILQLTENVIKSNTSDEDDD